MIVLYVFLYFVGAIIALALIGVLFLFVASLFVQNKEYDRISPFYKSIVTFCIKTGMCLCRVHVNVTGAEKLKEIDGELLFVGNHRSDFDPFAVIVGLKLKKLAFISKPENFKIPFFGKFIRKCLFLPIDRQNPKNAIKTINRASDLIKSGAASYFVYPEGTRSKSQNMLPFHDGVFKIAQKAEAPVAVVAVRGTEKVHKNAPWKKTVVCLDVVDVIDVKKVKTLSSHELSEIAREKIAALTEGK